MQLCANIITCHAEVVQLSDSGQGEWACLVVDKREKLYCTGRRICVRKSMQAKKNKYAVRP